MPLDSTLWKYSVMSDMLAAGDISKTYSSGGQQLEVLRRLSFSVPHGNMVAIMGASGSGKSTLLHLLGAMEKPDSGSIRVADVAVSSLNRTELSDFRNRMIGFVFQFHHLLPEFTALENVIMPLLIRGNLQAEINAVGEALLGDVGLGERSNHRPGELSGGEQQRVAIARALIGQPRILLADEPTGNLDPHTGDAVGRLIAQLHEKYKLTTILVTHNPRLASLGDRIYRLEEGCLVDNKM